MNVGYVHLSVPSAIGIMLVGVFSFCTAACAQDNLVSNPSFEVDEDADGIPDGWSFSWLTTRSGDTPDMGRQEPDWALDGDTAHDGERSVRTGVERTMDDGHWQQARVDLPAGVEIFRLGASIKVENADGGSAHVAVVYLAEDGKWLGADYDAIMVREDTDWRRFVALFKPAEGTSYIRLRLWTNFNRSGPITAWYDDIAIEPTDLQEMPPLKHIDPTPMPEISDADRARGYVPFEASYLDVVMPAIVPSPDQLDPTLRIFAAPGEREPISFAVRALEDQQGMAAEIGQFTGEAGALPADAVHAGVVRNIVRKIHPRTDDMLSLPAFIEDMRPVDVGADTSQWYWFTVRVPEDAQPGTYSASITISSSGGDAQIPVELEVLPIELMRPEGVAWGMYDYMHRTYSDAPDAIEEKFLDQRAYGMTSVGLCGAHGVETEMVDGEVVMHWTGETNLERAMNAYVTAGFPEPIQWLIAGDISRFAQQSGEIGSEEYADAYRGVIEAVLAKADEEGWPEIIFQPVDEAFEHRPRFERMMVEMKILKDMGLPVEADGMNGHPEGLEEALPLMDYLNFHDGPFLRRGVYDAAAWEQFRARMEDLGKTIWFYNVEIASHRPENARFSQGFHLWNTGAGGAYTWSYRSVIDDPYAANPGRRFIFMHRFPPMGDETGGPSIGFEALREGIDDYYYLHTWDRLCERALAEGTDAQKQVARTSRAWMADKLAEIDYSQWMGWPTQGEWTGGTLVSEEGAKAVAGHLKVPGVWDFADYDDIRRRLADWIEQLQ
ncbi:MAG: hypothetical protein GF393_06275 [Armatimonadia bacterium]|nr:hypothetical protein [Armatimonadia bacterium]